MMSVMIACGLTLLCYEHLRVKGYTNLMVTDFPATRLRATHSKKSFIHSFRNVLLSKKLIAIAIIVVGYNLVYTLSDFVFMKRVELSFGVDQCVESNQFLSKLSLYSGIIATFLGLFVNTVSMRYAGWTVTALITPFVFMITGIIFYLFQIDTLTTYLSLIVIDTHALALYAGAAHICFLRGSRYSLFDSTKEMAYIGLTQEERLNGKAFIDGIGSRLGRSGSSFIFCILFAILGNNIILTIPYVFFIVVLITIFWISSIYTLGNHQAALLKEKLLYPEPISI
jgi:AAA family ATP:ADP antiporter